MLSPERKPTEEGLLLCAKLEGCWRRATPRRSGVVNNGSEVADQLGW